ncbi:MAG TPA: amidase [Chloroflexia bacterium]|nr:amidase [Chloroflexia bacterium]
MTDINFYTATELAEAIRECRISCIEALEAHLAQIAHHNPRLNAVVTLDEERARHRAREADEAITRGELWGPLHGLPMTLKDGHSTAGMKTTSGYVPLADYVPEEDGTVAARLKAAGAIIIGKTNVSILLGDIQSDNPIFGRTNNPWDVSRTSGGSSGGAAAALATGMTPLEIGSDLAGSIRIPSHFCGVYGLKTTEHRVSMHGHIPDLPNEPRSHRHMWSIGPMARNVADLALAYRIISGPDGYDPDVPPVPVEASRGVPTARPYTSLRIAWAPTFPGAPVMGAIRHTLHDLASELDRLGARVEERLPDINFGELARTRVVLSRAVRLAFRPEEDEPPVTLTDYFTTLYRRDAFIDILERFFSEWDVLLCPVAMTTAFTHRPTDTPIEVDGEEANYWRVIGHCAPFNFTGHPSIVIPIGSDAKGLPIGVQIVGKRWGEEGLLEVAALIAEVAGPFRKPPGL